jgi:DNA-binding CsgD family transcriptional regulator
LTLPVSSSILSASGPRPRPLDALGVAENQISFKSTVAAIENCAMRKTEHVTTGAEVGFVLLDSTLHPVLLNRSAAEILSYPLKPGAQKAQRSPSAERVRIMLLASPSNGGSPIVSEFRSGKRLYHCRTFRVDAQTEEYSQLSLAVIFERGSSASLSLPQVALQYHLTTREQQVLEYLLQGLTSKEIADRMSISTNTVKAFLRLIMIKMGVSTRSGILGKAITSNSDIMYPSRPPAHQRED